MLMNGAQLHLAVNHLPVVGVLIGCFVLLVGILFKFLIVKRTGLFILAFSAISVLPTYFSGEPAEDLVENKPGVTKELIHEHEESAEFALILTAVTGLAAALTLALAKMKRENAEQKLMYVTLLISLFTFVVLARTAHLGGMIRHDELRGAIRIDFSSLKA